MLVIILSFKSLNITGINANSSFVGGLQMSAIDVDRDGRTELVFNQPGGLAIAVLFDFLRKMILMNLGEIKFRAVIKQLK
jgi:hypothetical protein